jgi:hypothetical protein
MYCIYLGGPGFLSIKLIASHIGLHQGSALMPYLFSLVMDDVAVDIQSGIP